MEVKLSIDFFKTEEKELIIAAQRLLTDPQAIELTYNPKDGITVKLNIACITSDDYKVAIVTEGVWQEEKGKLNCLELSWLDQKTETGQMLQYTFAGDAIVRSLHNINRPDDWVDGDVRDTRVYSFGEKVNSEEIPEIIKAILKSNSQFDDEIQSKIVGWYKMWYSTASVTGEADTKVL